MIEPATSATSRGLMRAAGAFYLLNIGFGAFAASQLMRGPSDAGTAANLVASVCYIVVTYCLYRLLGPTNRLVALIAALVSLAGCALSIALDLDWVVAPVGPLPLFGAYCLLTGWLLARSRLVPSWIGYALMVGGVGWLTFAIPDLRRALFPYNMAPAILAETALALALLLHRTKTASRISVEAG